MADGESDADKIAVLRKLYEQAFWLYTVIIALAIRQVLVGIIPRIFNHWLGTAFQLEAPGTHNEPSFYIELFQSLIFLVVITRFYLGGVKVFEELGKAPDKERSWLHVLTGFIHFVLFFGWAYTPFISTRLSLWRFSVSYFVVVLLLIVLWDVIWYFFSSSASKVEIKGWVLRNVRTALFIILCIAPIGLVCGRVVAEVLALLYVFVVSIVDFSEMFTSRKPPQNFFTPF